MHRELVIAKCEWFKPLFFLLIFSPSHIKCLSFVVSQQQKNKRNNNVPIIDKQEELIIVIVIIINVEPRFLLLAFTLLYFTWQKAHRFFVKLLLLLLLLFKRILGRDNEIMKLILYFKFALGPCRSGDTHEIWIV